MNKTQLHSIELPKIVAVEGHEYTLLSSVGSGVSGVVFRCRDRYSRDRAIKIAIREHYAERSYLEEVTRSAKLDGYPQFANILDAGIVELKLGGSPKKYVAFVEEWVDGVTLSEFVKDERNASLEVFREIARAFCDILYALESEELQHDDLNAGNIMLAKPQRRQMSGFWSVKVVDMASVKSCKKPTRKPKDDVRWIAEHLVSLWNALRRRSDLTVQDRRFLREAEKLIRCMLDDDPAIRLADPKQISSHFDQAFNRSQTSAQSDALTMTDPFDFISAERIWDDRLLVRIFAESCPWLPKVMGPDPCLITGPRGCGKSTIFRWLSLKAQLLAHTGGEHAKLRSLPLIGFYISCSADLQNRFAYIVDEETALKYEKEIIHYFNLLLLREILHVLVLLSQRPDRETYWGLAEAQEVAVRDFVISRLQPDNLTRLQGVSRVEQAQDIVRREIEFSQLRIARGQTKAVTTTVSFLGDLTTLLCQEIRIFQEKPITFLVDDFSIHRVSAAVQKVINKIVWERRSTHVFKLSSEKYGAQLLDPANATAEISREMLEIDCGQEYIALDDKRKQHLAKVFAAELLDNRLREATYRGTADTLIGRSSWEEGSLGRALREKKPGRLDNQYHGIECISQLCSGDIAALLLIYRRIFEEGKVRHDDNTVVAKHIQHSAVRYVSQKMFDSIRTYHPHGREMYEIVNQFGKFVRNVLAVGKMIKQGHSTVPPQIPRIEIDQVEGSVTDQLSSTHYSVATELVRRAIFIEMEPGLSRHGHVTTLRWQLRRIFLPVFNASLSKNDAIKRDPNWFKYFLSNPEEALNAELGRYRIGAQQEDWVG